jgi:hypothetical protein
VNRCNVDGSPVTAQALADSRIHSGGAIHPDDDFTFEIFWVDEDGSTDQNLGDSLVVCIDSPSRHITPLTIFAGWAGVLPNPVSLKSRTEMRVEIPYDGGDGSDPILEKDPGEPCEPV